MTIEELNVGAPAQRVLTARLLAVDFRWAPGFSIASVRLDQARLRVRVDEKGVSFGALDRYMRGKTGPPARRAMLPDLRLSITDAAVTIETPLGPIGAAAQAKGGLRTDFSGAIDIARHDIVGAAGGAKALEAHIVLRTNDQRLVASAKGGADSIAWRHGEQSNEISGARFDLAANAPITLENANIQAQTAAEKAALAGIAFAGFGADIQIDAGALGGNFMPESWNGQTHARLASAKGARVDAGALSADLAARGEDQRVEGRYALAVGRGGGFGINSPGAKVEGPFSGDISRDPWTFTAQGQLAAPNTTLDAPTRRTVATALPDLGGTPLQPLIAETRRAIDRAFARFSLAAPLTFNWDDGKGRLAASGATTLNAASGARVMMSPLSSAGPSLGLAIPTGAIEGGAIMEISGGGLPQGRLTLTRVTTGDGLTLQGRAEIGSWRGANAALTTPALDFDIADKAGVGAAHIRGNASLTGPLAGLSLIDASIPIDLGARWGGDGFRVSRPDGGCQAVQTARIDAAGMEFPKAALRLCPLGGDAFAATDGKGNYSGGFFIDRLALNGAMSGAPPRPARLTIARIESRLGGGGAGLRLDTNLQAPALSIQWDETRRINLRGDNVTANLLASEAGWRVTGRMRNVSAEDNTAPARVEAFNADLIIEPRGDEAVLRAANGAGRVFDWHETKLIEPLTLRDVEARLEGGEATAKGAIHLEKRGAALGRFTLTHDLASGKGEAAATARALTFSPALQPHDISETVRGVVANVAGPIDADIGAHWSGEDFRTDARFDLKSLNMATAALGPVEGVSGVVTFDDFAKLTTPPGQRITIAQINPGIVVKDGLIHFQMKPDLNVTLESAIWPFAGGRLSVLPTTFDFNSKETRLTLDLADVDVNELIRQLNIKDLAATGKVEGRFPLVFAEGKGRIENGRLAAAPGGGTIQYNSDFKQTGPAQLAFDALRSFRYDNLSLDLNGMLDDEVITSIAFSGVNREPVSQSAGPAPVRLVGIPFKFNVKVRAPFMALSRTAASITDARQVLNPTDATTPAPP